MSRVATTNQATDSRDVLRWYTRARRIPRLIGKLSGSDRGIPGGPYTITQAIGAISVGLGLLKTEPLWGQFGWISNKIIILVATAATAFLLRFVKPGGRDPLSALTALLSVATASRHGRLKGRQLKARKPVRVHARVRVVSASPYAQPALEVLEPALEPVDGLLTPEPAALVDEIFKPVPGPPSLRRPVRPIPALAGSRPRTNLERMLLQAQEA